MIDAIAERHGLTLHVLLSILCTGETMSTLRHARGLNSLALSFAATFMIGAPVFAAGEHFDQFVDGNYTSKIYAGPIQGGCGAWTGNNLLLRLGNTLYEYDATNTHTYHSTIVHDLVTPHVISGLDNPGSGGVGMTTGADGMLYMCGPSGLQRVNPNTWGPAVTLPNTVGGQGYGINVLPNGKIVYSDGNGASKLYVYDTNTNVNTLIYSANYLIDDIETGPASAAHPNGVIAVAGQSNSSIAIFDDVGNVINQFSTPHFPDGLAFGDGSIFNNCIYANNNDGSITRYDFSGANFTGSATPTDIALCQAGHRGYGDLAAVGPDCAFYIGTFANIPLHGADSNVGTNWNDGVTNSDNSIVRISLNDLTGTNECGFYNVTEHFPEPASLGVICLAVVPMMRRRRA